MKKMNTAHFVLACVLLATNVAGFSIAIANYVISLIAYLKDKKGQA